MKQSIYDRYFQSLLVYTKNNLPNKNIVLINFENLDGFVEFEFVLRYHKLNNIRTPILILNLNWDKEHPIKITNNKNPLNIENVRVNGKDDVHIEYKNNLTYIYLKELIQSDIITITMHSITALIPLSESIPFNRYVLHLDFIVQEKINESFLVKINRNAEFSTKFTKGNFALAFPSRLKNNKKVTNIYYTKQTNKRYFLKMGFSDERENHLSADASAFFKLSLTAILLYIILRLSNDTVLKILGGYLFIGVPLFDYFPEVFGHDRFKYYIGKSDITKASIIVMSINSLISFLIFTLHLSNIYSNLFILLLQSIVLLIIFLVLMVFAKIGTFHRYVCDMSYCESHLYNRLAAYNCYLTGRVVCKKCEDKYCKDCNFYKNKYVKNFIPPCQKRCQI